LKDVEKRGVPVIHFGVGTQSLLPAMRDAGGTVIGLDWKMPITSTWERIGRDKAIQGNLDPLLLCAPVEIAKARARAILDEVGDAPGHVFNIGHGIIPETPPDTVRAVVEHVHEHSRKIRSGT
jgi:uroporphyrinogen decarboxylase